MATSLQKFGPTHKFLRTHLQEQNLNGSRVTHHIPLSRNWLSQLRDPYVSNLHTMSLAKAVPNSLKDRKCKKMALREGPSIPYVPKKDCVQERALSFKDKYLKTQIRCWYQNHERVRYRAGL
jgi:hypothetical protein